MNITFLIGNGFDLNLGLNTSYRAFIKSYLSDTTGDSDLIKRFKHDIETDLDTWANAELALGKYTRNFTGENPGEEYLICYRDFYQKLAEHIELEDKRVSTCNVQSLLEGFAFGLNHFTDGFRRLRTAHIQEPISGSGIYTFNFIVFNYTRAADVCIEGLKAKPGYLQKRVLGSSTYQNKVGETIHVHGYVDRDMILGVNDESQLTTPEIFTDMSIYEYGQLIKKDANEMFEEDVDSRTLDILNKSHFIYIYGMSIGETDKLWWQRIGKLLCQNPKLQVIIQCYDAPDDNREHLSLLSYEDKLRHRLCAFCDDLDIDILTAAERVHVTGYNIFAKLTNAVPDAEKATGDASIA